MHVPSVPRMNAGSAFWLVACWAALDGGVAVYLHVNGVNAVSSALLLASAAAFAVAVARSGRGAGSAQGVLLALVATQLVLRIVAPYQPGSPSSDRLIPLLAMIAVALVVSSVVLVMRSAPARLAGACLMGVALLGLASRAAVVLGDPYPTFDVPLIQEAAGAALRTGGDPYLTHVYDSGYPYFPIAAIAAAIAGVFGDARWAIVAGDAMTTLGLVLLARRLHASSLLGPTMASLWAWWAGGLYVAWQGFPEPLLLGFLTLGVVASVGPRRHRVMGGVLLGLSAATKQFGVAALPYLVQFRDGRRVLTVAVVTAVLVVVPFALWHPSEFLEGTFWSLLAEPGRDYSLNLLVWPGGRLDPPYVPTLVGALIAGWLVSRRFARADVDAGWLAGSTTLLLIAFLTNRIAFVNYYAVVMLLLLLLVTVLVAGTRKAPDDAPPWAAPP